MRKLAALAVCLLAAAPAFAGSKLGKSKKFIICAVGGEQSVPLGFEKDGVAPPRVEIVDAFEAGAKALEDGLSEAGVSFVPFAEAEAAAKARQAKEFGDAKTQLDGSANTSGAAAEAGANAGGDAVMQAIMNNPGMTAEQKEQYRKAFAASAGASKGQVAAAVSNKAQSGYGDMLATGRAAAEAKANSNGSPSTGHVRSYCPRAGDEIQPDEEGRRGIGGTHYYAFRDEMGADGWLYVDATFGVVQGPGPAGYQPTLAAAGMAKATAKSYWIPRWEFQVKSYDKKGKLVWQNRKPIQSDNVEIGKTKASAKKAIAASAPEAVKAVVEALTK